MIALLPLISATPVQDAMPVGLFGSASFGELLGQEPESDAGDSRDTEPDVSMWVPALTPPPPPVQIPLFFGLQEGLPISNWFAAAQDSVLDPTPIASPEPLNLRQHQTEAPPINTAFDLSISEFDKPTPSPAGRPGVPCPGQSSVAQAEAPAAQAEAPAPMSRPAPVAPLEETRPAGREPFGFQPKREGRKELQVRLSEPQHVVQTDRASYGAEQKAPPAGPPAPPVKAEATAVTNVAELVEIASSSPDAPIRDLNLRLQTGERERVDLRISDRGGEVLVSVRADQAHLAQHLRERLPELINSLHAGAAPEHAATSIEAFQGAETSGENPSHDRREADDNTPDHNRHKRKSDSESWRESLEEIRRTMR